MKSVALKAASWQPLATINKLVEIDSAYLLLCFLLFLLLTIALFYCRFVLSIIAVFLYK